MVFAIQYNLRGTFCNPFLPLDRPELLFNEGVFLPREAGSFNEKTHLPDRNFYLVRELRVQRRGDFIEVIVLFEFFVNFILLY